MSNVRRFRVGMRIEHLIDCENHLATVANWQQAEFGYLNPSVTIEQRRSRLLESLQRDGLPLTIVAVSEESLAIGAATLLPKTITHQHLTPWLSTVVVPPEFRGKGIASALSLRAVSEAARLGFKTLNLFTPRNESLYKRLGWETCERSNHNGLPIAIMSRPTSA
jgi:predicted N-acetyltransferase YhbS